MNNKFDDEFIAIPIYTIIVTSETVFDEIDLGDGLYLMMYIMEDSQNNLINYVSFTFEIIDDEIYTSVD